MDGTEEGWYCIKFQTFEELEKLAQEGDSRNVHVQLFDIIKKMTATDDVYTSMVKELEDEITFCLGKAPGKTTGQRDFTFTSR